MDGDRLRADAYDAVEAVALRAGADSIPIAVPGAALEGGRRFRVGGTVYTLPLAVYHRGNRPGRELIQTLASDYVARDWGLLQRGIRSGRIIESAWRGGPPPTQGHSGPEGKGPPRSPGAAARRGSSRSPW